MHIFGTLKTDWLFEISKNSKTIEIFWKIKGNILERKYSYQKLKSTLYNQIPNPLKLPSVAESNALTKHS